MLDVFKPHNKITTDTPIDVTFFINSEHTPHINLVVFLLTLNKVAHETSQS